MEERQNNCVMCRRGLHNRRYQRHLLTDILARDRPDFAAYVHQNAELEAGYQDVKALLFDKCGLTNIILDNLVNEGKSKRVTVGVSEEGDAAILVRKINGLYINGQQLFVEDQRKKRSEQPYVCNQQLTQHREERSHDYVGQEYSSSNQGYAVRGSDQGGRSQEYLRGGEYSDRGVGGYSERPHDSKISQELLRGRETSRQNRDFPGRSSNYPPQHQEYSKREDPVRETEYAIQYNEYSGRKQESSSRNRGQEYLGHEQDPSRSQNASRSLGPRNQDYLSRATDNMGGRSPRENDYSPYRADDHRVQKNQEYPSQHVLTNRDLARNPYAMGAAERSLQRSEDLVQMEQAQQQAIETLHYENQMMGMVPDPSYSSQDMMAPMMIAPQMVPEPMMGGYGAPASSQMYYVGPAQTIYGYGGDQPQIQIPSLLSQPLPEMMLPVANQVPAVKNQNDVGKRASYQGVLKSRWDNCVVPQQRARREVERHEPTRASLRSQPQDNASSRRQGNVSRDRYREDETLANIRRQDIPTKDRFREDETRTNTRRQGISVRDHFREDQTHSTTRRISVRDRFREDENHPNTRRQSINAVKQVDSAFRQIRGEPKRKNRKRHLSPNNNWIPPVDTRRRGSFSHDLESDYHSETRMAQAGSIAPSYVRDDISAGNVGCSNEPISIQPAGKNKLPPYKPNTIPQIMRQEKKLRKRAVIQLAVTLLKTNGYPDMVDPELFTKLKISIENRIDMVLGENIGTEFEYMLKTYRAAFPISGDSKFLKAVIAKVQNKGKNTSGPREAAPKPANTNDTGHSGAPTKKKLKKVHVEPGNLPTCPQASKAAAREIKLQTKREFSGEQTYTLEPPLEQALEDELEELAQIFVNTCETPDKPEEAALCEKLCEPNVVEHFKQVVQLHVSKRILKIQTNLVVRIFGHPKAPNREQLQQFLQGYGVTSLKKSKGSKMYIATLSGYKNFDKLCKMENVSISNNKVTFKAMHLAGPPPKLTRHDIDKLREKRKRKMHKWNKTILSVDKPQAVAIKPQPQTNTDDNNRDKNKTGENHTETVNIKNDVDDQFNFENGGNWDELTEAQQITMVKKQENELEDWAIMDPEDDMTVLDEVGEDIEDGITKGLNAAEDDPDDFPDIDVSDLKDDDLEDY